MKLRVRQRLAYWVKNSPRVQRVYRLVCSSVLHMLGWFIPIDRRLVLFSSFSGKSYNDSPRVLYEAMRRRKEFADFRYVWAFEDPARHRVDGAERVRIDSLAYFLKVLRAGVWITNTNMERGLKVPGRKHRVSLNTWHAVSFKLIGNAVKGRSDYDWSTVDVVCCSGEYEAGIFVRNFNAKRSSLLMCGMPRNDILYTPPEGLGRSLSERLRLPAGKKVILYAPTWRESEDGGASYEIAPPLNAKRWERELGADYVVLFKAHPFTGYIKRIEFNDFFRNVSDYPDINELYLVSDVLITDYSSAFFDFAILRRPIICFGYDYEAYRRTRGFYVDINAELPGGVMATEEEVLARIRNLKTNWDEEVRMVDRFRDKYIECRGGATEACLQAILDQCKRLQER